MIRFYVEADPESEHVHFDGKVRASYYIGPSNYEDYIEETKIFLERFITNQNKYPVFLTMEPFEDMVEEIIDFFKERGIDYILHEIKWEGVSFPVVTAIISDKDKLNVLLKETFYLPSANQFYALSYRNNVSYKLQRMTGVFGKKVNIPLPLIKMEEDSTVITIYHDGQGILLFSNDSRFESIELVRQEIPTDLEIE